jgi:hypothetical protein
MRCKPNQLCWINKAIRKENVGRVVTTQTHIGHFSRGDEMKINVSGYPEVMVAHDTDDYWIITSKSMDLVNYYGKTDTLIIMDSWLTPIIPDGDCVNYDEELEEELVISV